MIDKKINETIDTLIKKIKDNNLASIKLSNKTNTIEILSNTNNRNLNQNNQNILTDINQNTNNNNNENLITIDSPMVGIIYLSPKPSSPPFAKKGQKIKKGDILCLIEAMKTFNEIKSDNGEAVEFGQPLFEIS